jgi:DNA-binding transcriptional ArsR family regulator
VVTLDAREYAEKWPDELLLANAEMSKEVARGIFLYLLDEAKSTSFKELSERLKVRQDLLSYHLAGLLKAGMVENVFERRPGTRERSFYFVSEYGKKFADSQLAVMEDLWGASSIIAKPVYIADTSRHSLRSSLFRWPRTPSPSGAFLLDADTPLKTGDLQAFIDILLGGLQTPSTATTVGEVARPVVIDELSGKDQRKRVASAAA